MRLTIILCVLCALCGSVFGANEIAAFAPGVTTAYSVVREADGDVWYVTGEVFEVWGTGARTAADYDIALTNKSGGMFVGNMDTNIAAGQYYVVTHQQAGGAPADTDPAVWMDYGYWTGTTWTSGPDASDIDSILEDTGTTLPGLIAAIDIDEGAIADAVWDEAMADHTGEATFGGELQQLDPNVTLILADTNDLQTWWADGGRLDLLIDLIKAMTDLIAIVTTTVADSNDANSFTLTAGLDVNDAYWLNVIMVEDATDGHKEIRYIEDWLSTRVVVVDETLGFTPEAGDKVWIMGTSYGGYLYDILYRVKLSSIPVYHFDTTTDGSGSTSGQAGTTYYDGSGRDP